MNTDNRIEFLCKLQRLLSEYNASIYWRFNDCSDMHGVSGEGVGISIGNDEALKVQGMHLNAYAIKQEIE